MPLAVGLASVAAVLLWTPFRLVHDNIWLTGICVAAAGAGLILRAMASSRILADDDLGAEGIYSIIRFPDLTAGLLLILAVTLYTGALWFAAAAILLSVSAAWCMVLSREHSLEARYGERFTAWCRTTGALTPNPMGWKRRSVRARPLKLLWGQMPMACLVAAGFCAVDFFKSLAVDFSATLSAGWMAVFVGTAVLAIAARLLKW